MFKGIKCYIQLCIKYNQKYMVLLLIRPILSILQSIIVVILPKYIIDYLFVYKQVREALISLGVLLIGTLVLGILANYLSKVILVERMETFKMFQIDLGKKMMSAPLAEIESKQFLDLKNKAEQFIYGGGTGFGTIIELACDGIGSLISVVIYAGIVVQLNIGVLVTLVVLIGINIAFNSYFQKKNIEINLEKAIQERRNSYYTRVFQDFAYGKEIRVFNLSNGLIDKYEEQLNKMQSFYNRLGTNNLKYGLISQISTVLQQLVAYAYIILSALKGLITIGTFSMYLNAISTFSSSLKDVINKLIMMDQYTDYYSAYEEYTNMENIYNNERSIKNINKDKFIIEFKHVTFQYAGSKTTALNDISFKIQKGETISIVGKNGAGKSTLIKLLLGIYKPTSGEIYFNDQNINDIDYSEYISIFATVFQDYKLFSMTLMENIVFESPIDQVAYDRVWKIFKQLGLDRKIKKLPNGLDNYIYRDFSDEGFTPSGGEAQKIAIARTIYKDAMCLILDEPTASLDPESEFEIFEQLEALGKGKTVIFISHRLSSTKFTKKILVLENGKLVQQGSHKQLLEEKGIYSELYNKQIFYYDM
ncbi:MAG: ABC transporter ATP-binding protein [Lachnospiraceae bacterium]|nr:ABC transporter ATP-binding protein [Lachnospiraceae bacterium]